MKGTTTATVITFSTNTVITIIFAATSFVFTAFLLFHFAVINLVDSVHSSIIRCNLLYTVYTDFSV